MPEQFSGPTTTSDSASDGRLKVGAGCPHGRKKCLKCAMGKCKKDGKGGPGMPPLNFSVGSGGFGAEPASPDSLPSAAMPRLTSKPHKSLKIPSGLKPKVAKKMKFAASATPKRFKSMKIKKTPKLHTMKMKRLKNLLGSK